MGGFFDLDGPFQKYGGLVADIIILSLLWTIFSIPIFTIGAATTSLFYVMTKRANNRDEYMFMPFVKNFKNNFLQGTILFFIFAFAYLVLTINIQVLGKGVLNLPPILGQIFFIAQFSILLEVFIVGLYIFPVLSRFHLKTKDVIKTSFFLANKHILSTIQVVAIIIAIGFLIIKVHPLFIVPSMGIYSFVSSQVFVRVFKKYKPDMDEYPEDPGNTDADRNHLNRRIIESGNYIPDIKDVSTTTKNEIKKDVPIIENSLNMQGDNKTEDIGELSKESDDTEAVERIDPRLL
ncbi:MAG: YesL family protein [Lachnospirales bacterium]